MSTSTTPESWLVQEAGFPEPGAYHGREGIGEYMRTFLEAWTNLTIEADDFLVAGDTVVAEVVQHATGKGSGAAPAEMRYYHLWSFRGRKVIRLEVVRNRAEALEAAGMREWLLD